MFVTCVWQEIILVIVDDVTDSNKRTRKGQFGRQVVGKSEKALGLVAVAERSIDVIHWRWWQHKHPS